VLLTDSHPRDVAVPPDVEVREVAGIASRRDYSAFIMKRLVEHVETSHVLVTQWDGYVVRPEAWHAEFLDQDYIGAPWRNAAEGFRVGNGGFSLRSRRLLTALSDDRFRPVLNEDQDICGSYRPALERDYAIRFADEALADSFSFETDPGPWLAGTPIFGFHGFYNLFLTESQAEIARLAETLPHEVLRSSACRDLLSNCVNYKQWDAGIALGTRMLEADADDYTTAGLVTAARTFRAADAAVRAPRTASMAARLLGWARSRR